MSAAGTYFTRGHRIFAWSFAAGLVVLVAGVVAGLVGFVTATVREARRW